MGREWGESSVFLVLSTEEACICKLLAMVLSLEFFFFLLIAYKKPLGQNSVDKQLHCFEREVLLCLLRVMQ